MTGAPFSKLKQRPRGEDPPDCEMLDANGRRVAVEITELVDREAVEIVAKDRRLLVEKPRSPLSKEWNSSKLLANLQECISRKDFRERLKGGPYDEYVVVIYTAEQQLNSTTVNQWLENQRFGSPKGIDRVYLSLDYEPGDGYPLIRLVW